MAMDLAIEGNTAQGLSRAFQSRDLWLRHEATFRELYCVQRKTLKEVKEEMEMNRGFPSTPLSTYETKLRDVLMLRKNLTKDEWPVIGHHLKKRKLEGKLSQVFLNRVPLPNCKVQKELRRNKHVLQDEEPTTTALPFEVDIKTPPALLSPSHIQPEPQRPRSNPFLPHDTTVIMEQIQKESNNCHRIISSASTDSKSLQEAFSSWKRPRTSDYHGISKRRRSTLFCDSAVTNGLSLFQSQSVIDRANKDGIIGIPRHELPYVQLQWILHGIRMPNPVEIPRSTRFANQIPGESLNTEPKQGFQIGSGAMSSCDFLKTALFFLSNDLLDFGGETALIKDLENQDNQQATIDVLFSIDTPTVRAAWEVLIRLVIERQSSLYRPLLLTGCRKREWIASLAPTLASAAIRFFDSAEAIEHIRRLRIAQVSLVERAISIDFGDDTFLDDSLQEALNKADAEIVKELMSDVHVPDSAEEYRKERFLYIPERFQDGFDECPEEQRMTCLKAMVDCGLRLHEPADHGYDEFRRLGCVLPLNCYNTLDQLFELELVREYEMLLPYSRKFSKLAMVCGILSAARNGDCAVSEYLAARTLFMDEDLLILKEIALCKTVFLPQDRRYAVLHCLLRNGVNPNIPHLSPYFNDYDENHVDTAVRNHDLKYLAILLDGGLVIDSARVLHALFYKRHWDEPVEPLSTRLRTLGFLRDNGLDIKTHGMVALAAFLKGGFWSRSNLEVSPPLDDILTLLRTLLDAAADVNMVIDKWGNTILHATAGSRFGSPAMITALIEAGANIQAININGRTALHQAIVSGGPSWFEIVECLLKHDAVSTYLVQDHTILEDLVRLPRDLFPENLDEIMAVFAMLLSRRACINNPNTVAGPSTLALMIEKRMPSELIKMVLEAGADVNAPVVLTSGLYPVQAAAAAENSPILMDLLNRGGDINAPAAVNFGRTALQSACLLEGGPNLTLVQDLLARGADVNAPAGYENGVTALQAAAMAGHIDVAKMLIENGARLDLPPAIKNGNLPLDGAARVGRLDMVQYLMNLGAISQEPGATRYDGAIKLAESGGHFAVADLMRKHAARLDEEQIWWMDYLDDAALEGFATDISLSTGSW